MKEYRLLSYEHKILYFDSCSHFHSQSIIVVVSHIFFQAIIKEEMLNLPRKHFLWDFHSLFQLGGGSTGGDMLGGLGDIFGMPSSQSYVPPQEVSCLTCFLPCSFHFFILMVRELSLPGKCG